jgi:hypothetical protein
MPEHSAGDPHGVELVTLARFASVAGHAVLAIDHVVKSTESRDRWPIGSQGKLAGTDVALAFGVDKSIPRSRTTKFQPFSRQGPRRKVPCASAPSGAAHRRATQAKIVPLSFVDSTIVAVSVTSDPRNIGVQ